MRPGTKYRDVGTEIQKHAQSDGFSVVRSYCGHGKTSDHFRGFTEIQFFGSVSVETFARRRFSWPKRLIGRIPDRIRSYKTFRYAEIILASLGSPFFLFALVSSSSPIVQKVSIVTGLSFSCITITNFLLPFVFLWTFDFLSEFFGAIVGFVLFLCPLLPIKCFKICHRLLA